MATNKLSFGGCLWSALALTVTTTAACIWLYLLYQILLRVGASAPMWTAYWVYVPVQGVALCLYAVKDFMKPEAREDGS